MPPDPAVSQGPVQPPNKKQDDFDMTKLQKALKNDQRKSIISKPKVAKLTPAEIRSLNHSVGLSKNGSVRSVDNHSIHRLSSTATPPLTPDDYASSRRSQSQRRSSVDLPTPPLSPDRERRGSSSSNRYIHAPKPLSHAQAVHLANVAGQSRPSSQTSYRGVATYRGNEITRNNSLTMLQHPSQVIVSNPLSQFSRPRQSTMTSTTSPTKTSLEQQPTGEITSPVSAKERTQSLGGNRQDFTRGNSPVRPSDSPVSMEDGQIPRRSRKDNPVDSEEVPVMHVTPRIDDAVEKDDLTSPTEPTAKQKLNWRRLTGSNEPDPEVARLRKEYRRRTLLSPKNGYCLHAIRYDDTKPGEPPQLRDSLKDELPSVKTSVFKEDERNQASAETEYGQHPAVRPLSHDTQRSTANESDSSTPSSSNKGKEREIDYPGTADSDASSISSSVPSYSRCSCCGRVQKPGGFESELSPVMENENLRTNFNFEADRMSPHRQRRSSSSTTDTPRRYIPIIPMEIGNETKQARIEPMKESMPQPSETMPVLRGVAINKLGDIIAPGSTPLAIMPRRKIDSRVVRFASLHRTKDDVSEDQNQNQSMEPAQGLAPQPQIQRFGSLYGMRDEVQQQQQPPPQNQDSQSAYQAQQAGQQQRSNGNHPLRATHNAYREVTLPQPEPGTGPYQTPEYRDESVVENLSGDSPVMKRADPQFHHSNFADEDTAGVDLSSFDGSYVYGSLSRSATIRQDLSPPGTSLGRQHDLTSNSSLPTPIHTTEDGASINNTNTTHFAPPAQPSMIQPQNNNSQPLPPLATTPSNTSSNTTTIHKSTTVVRIIPSAPVSAPDSPAGSSKGPMRLGDWILPESPTQSVSSKKGSVQSEKRRVAAA